MNQIQAHQQLKSSVTTEPALNQCLRQKTQLETAIDVCIQSCDRLNALICNLKAQLEPISQHSEPPLNKPVGEEARANVVVLDALQGIRQRVDVASEQLQDTLKRLVC